MQSPYHPYSFLLQQHQIQQLLSFYAEELGKVGFRPLLCIFWYFSSMNKVILLLFVGFSINAQNIVGNFRVSNNKIIWQKTYKKSLNINNQIITLRALDFSTKSSNFWIKSIRGAKLNVEKKPNQTVISVIDIYSIPKFYFTLTWFFGIEQNVTPKYIEEKYLFKRNLRKKFINKDARIIDKIIQNEINSILSFKEN